MLRTVAGMVPALRLVVLAVAFAVSVVPPVQASGATAPAELPGLGVRPVPGRVAKHFKPPLTSYGAGHRGVDLRARPGEPVVSALGGTVTFAGDVAGVSWVTVDHGGGVTTTYGPISPRIVRAGVVVSAGEVVGFVAPGARHLDWGARLDGNYLDPLALLAGWETYLTANDDVPELPALGGPAAMVGRAAAARGALALPARGPVTSSFGPRVHPVTGAQRLHAGLDIGAASGVPVVAAAPGTVSFAGDVGGYGRTVMVDHGGGVTTLYGHQSSLDVSTGDRVSAGARLGRVGATGVATGPHLHFEVRVNGVPQDPAAWLRP